MPRPCWIIRGESPDGKMDWAVPPDCHTGSYHMVGVKDWLRDPATWNFRSLSQLSGCGVDTLHMIRENARVNIGCDARQPCRGCADYAEGARTDEEMQGKSAVCRKWQLFGRNWRELWGKEDGKIALLLAPGPHLLDHKDEIETLAKDRDHYFVMGCSRALFSGIGLRYYVTLERRKPAKMNTIRESFPETTLIASTITDWAMVKCFREGRRFYGETFNTVDEEGRWIDSGMERLTVALGNVSADQIVAAYRLGAKELWLYGYESAVSLCPGTTKDGKPTELVDNYYFDMKVSDRHLQFYTVTFSPWFGMWGVDGKKCASSYELTAISAYCEALCMLLDEHGVKCVNKTMKGNFWLGYEDPEVKALKARIADLELHVRGRLPETLQQAVATQVAREAGEVPRAG